LIVILLCGGGWGASRYGYGGGWGGGSIVGLILVVLLIIWLFGGVGHTVY
jgi:hypothetical protein